MPKKKSKKPMITDLLMRLTTYEMDKWDPFGPIESVSLEHGPDAPSRKFKKDVIRTGEYVKLSDGLAFTVSLATLKNWVLQFKRMQANGVKVSIPNTHSGDGDPKQNMGWVEDLWIDGGTLWMSCTLIGDDALVAAKRSDVSLNSPVTFVDGKGTAYKQPITHVAMCTDPVVPGLGEFVPIAASLKIKKLAHGEIIMLDFLKELGALLGLDPEAMVDEQTAAAMLKDAVTALSESKPKDANDQTKEVPASSESTDSPVKKQTLTTEYAGRFSNKPEEPNPLMVKTIAENRALKIKGLVTAGKITPAVADKLTLQFIGEKNNAVAMELSTGSDGSDFDAMIDAFEANDPIRLGQRTGPQFSMTMSDPSKANGKPKVSPLVADAERRAKAAAGK